MRFGIFGCESDRRLAVLGCLALEISGCAAFALVKCLSSLQEHAPTEFAALA